MKNLPINKILPDIKDILNHESKLIVQAPPGAGKSTVVPISLLNEQWLGDKIIILLEPRRLAARMIASLMSKFLNEEVGQTVGYQIKMDTCKSEKTKILVVTEAILVRILQSNQSLDNVGLIIFDEFHERSINTDLSLALSLQVQELLRDDLKLLIMSATLNSKELSTLLDNTPIITSEGKTFDIENIYLEANIKQPDYKSINTILLNTLEKSLKEDNGDILVFLAGLSEIKKLESLLIDLIKNKFKDNDILVFPLHSNLNKQEQDNAIKKHTNRKVILATNIAQTSLTIEGISIVIDTGLEKRSYFNHASSMDYLELGFISIDSSVQRAGRAGRLSNGKCYKLWHKNKILQKSTEAEILRSDLSSLILDLSLWGVSDFNELKWLDIPSESRINKTKVVLQELNMLDDNFSITHFGKDSLSLGVHPRFSYMILKAYEMNYSYEACLIASILSNKDIFINSFKDSNLASRFSIFVNKQYNSSFVNRNTINMVLKDADFFFNKLNNIKKQKLNKNRLDSNILPILALLAYPDRLAKQRKKDDNKYKLSNGKGCILNIEDELFNHEYLVVPNINISGNNSFINMALSIDENDIFEYFSSVIEEKESISYNKENKKIDIRINKYFYELEISSNPSSKIDKNRYKDIILQLLKKEGLSLLTWNNKSIELINRVNFFNYQNDLNNKFILKSDFPDFSDNELLKSVDTWLEPYLSNIFSLKDLEKLDLYNILFSSLSWQDQKLLEELVPSHIKVPSSSMIKIDYSNKEIAILPVKIQEMFGLNDTPKILNNTFALQIHLLSPGLRPIQITFDLKSFWLNSYAEVRKELRGKYKRHYWPEDPFEAIATSKTKKHLLSKKFGI